MGTPPPPSWRKPSHVSARRSGGGGCDSGDGVGGDGGVSLRFPLGMGRSGRVVLLGVCFESLSVLE